MKYTIDNIRKNKNAKVNIPLDDRFYLEKIYAYRNLGSFVVAKNFNDGYYVVSVNGNTVCNTFFDELIHDYDEDFAPYLKQEECEQENNYDFDDDYQRADLVYRSPQIDDGRTFTFFLEREKEDEPNYRKGPNCSKYEYLQAICVLLGRIATEELIFGCTHNTIDSTVEIIYDMLREMASWGMFGVDLLFSTDTSNDLPHSQDKLDELNAHFEKVIKNCYQIAEKIVKANEQLILSLAPVVVKVGKALDETDFEPILEKHGGVVLL